MLPVALNVEGILADQVLGAVIHRRHGRKRRAAGAACGVQLADPRYALVGMHPHVDKAAGPQGLDLRDFHSDLSKSLQTMAMSTTV